ncbi:NAD(P)/FAD-dependent oxidoreductase [Fusibacter bizertensis]
MLDYDSIVIGGGPAGLAAAYQMKIEGANVLILEREDRLGGILKQCIHDGFGLIEFNQVLTGPEYADYFVSAVVAAKIDIVTKTFVTDIQRMKEGFQVTTVNSRKGVQKLTCKTIILATGCRERTSKQLMITGDRPAGIYTAGTAQYMVNIEGLLPCSQCVILGSGDIGLIMARRLTLEGAKVVGVYESKATPSGLARNIQQCLVDFDIPIHYRQTVVEVHGRERLESVTIAEVDAQMKIVSGSEKTIPCDGLILSVGLIPENEIAEKLHVSIDTRTNGPIVDEQMMTSVPGVFSCGNALKVFDLVDHVTANARIAGKNAIKYIQKGRELIG